MQFITNYKVENYILNTKWENLPSDIQERVIQCSIDLMGALVLGSQGKQYKAGIRTATRLGLSGASSVLGEKNKYNLLGAAIAYSHASNSFDIDDGYNLIKGHPGASFVGGVLAAALEQDATYEEYLTTLLVCYEITIRWGLAEQKHYGFLHSTGTYGAFGTAAGAGRLLGLDKKALNNALSIADYHAPLTPVMRAVEYPSMNKDGVPFGTLVGMMAVIETQEGETGRTHLLEMPEFEGFVDSLDKEFYIKDLYFKPYTCCRWAHQPILACQEMMNKYKFSYEKIEKVTIHTFEAAARLSKAVPTNTDEAQYNIAFPIACALVHGDVGFMQVRDEAIGNKKVLGMMEKLSFLVDPEIEEKFPEKRFAWVEIELRDGTIFKSKMYEAPGEHTDPNLNFDWIVKKFKRVTGPVLNYEGQKEILDLLTSCSKIPVRTIIETVNHHLSKMG